MQEAAGYQGTKRMRGQGAAPEVGVRQSVLHRDAPARVQRHHQRQQRQCILARLHSASGLDFHHCLMCAMFISCGSHLSLDVFLKAVRHSLGGDSVSQKFTSQRTELLIGQHESRKTLSLRLPGLCPAWHAPQQEPQLCAGDRLALPHHLTMRQV